MIAYRRTAARNATIAVSLLFVLLSTGCDMLAPPPAPVVQPEPSVPGVVFVNLTAVAKAVGQDEFLKNQIAAANNTLSQQLNTIAGKLNKQLEEEKGKVAGEPADADVKRLQKLNVQARQRLQQVQQEARTKAQQFRAGLVKKFVDEIRPLAQKAATERGAAAVQVTGAAVVWVDPAFDITDAVIAALVAKRKNDPPAKAPAQAATN